VLDAAILTLGTLSTLIYFQFSTRRVEGGSTRVRIIMNRIGLVGQIFIAITFGALFYGVYLAALSAFIERINFLWSIIRDFFIPAFF
jgi:hypothetical protein